MTALSYFREVSEQRGVAGRAEKTQEDISVQGVSQKLARAAIQGLHSLEQEAEIELRDKASLQEIEKARKLV